MSHGGKRSGAGRPPIDPEMKKVTYATKLPQWLVDWLREQDNAAVTIEEALCKRHKLKPPST